MVEREWEGNTRVERREREEKGQGQIERKGGLECSPLSKNPVGTHAVDPLTPCFHSLYDTSWTTSDMQSVSKVLQQNIQLSKQIVYQLCTQQVEGIYSNSATLKSRLGVTQGHWKWHHSIDRILVPISVPQYIPGLFQCAVLHKNCSSKWICAVLKGSLCSSKMT